MSLIERVERGEIEPEVSRPDRARLVHGDPVHSTWSVENGPGVFAGIWQSTPGTWRVRYDEWEYVYIHKGHSILTGADGQPVHLMAGDSYVIRPGFEGTWEVVETTVKDYVIVA